VELDGYEVSYNVLCCRRETLIRLFGLQGDITKDTAEKIFDTYVQKGGNFIDTANKVRRSPIPWSIPFASSALDFSSTDE
jgi:hypothetical protein